MKMWKCLDKMRKIILIFVIIQIVFLITINVTVKAESDSSLQGIIDKGNNFISMSQDGSSDLNLDTTIIWEKMLKIAKGLTVIGFGVVIVMALTLIPTIKGDNPDERAKAKNRLIGFVIAVICLAGAYKIWSFALQMLDKVSPTGINSDEIISAMDTTRGPIGDLPPLVANILNLVISAAQVGFTGYYVVRFTWEGIVYFFYNARPATEQAASKNRLYWYLLKGVLAFGATSFVKIIYNILS